MFLPNSHSFLLVRPVIKKPVINPVRSSLAEVSLETRAFGASETSNGIQSGIKEPATSLPPFSSSDSGLPRFGEAGSPRFGPASTRLGEAGEAGRKIFLSNSHSFLLVRSVISKPVIHPVRSSLAEVSLETRAFDASETSNGIQEPATSLSPSSSSDSGDSGKQTIVNKDKRTFLKLAGIAGASIVGSLLLPKKADAFIMGSSPTTGVVGVKNSTNTRINPATEETLDEVLKTTDLSLTAGVLDVNVTSLPGAGSSSFSDSGNVDKKGLVDEARHLQVDVLTSALPSSASTETTLQTISFGGFKFAFKMTTVGSVDYVGEAAVGTATSSALWRAKKVDSTTGIVITWADGNANFDNVATDLTTLTYS